MTLEDIGNIALICSASGILISAIMVAVQFRVANNLFRIQQRDARMRGLNDYKTRMLHPDVAGLLVRARKSYSDLSEVDKLRFETLIEMAMPSIVSIYRFAHLSTVETKKAQGFAILHVIDLTDNPGAREWWAERREKAVLGGPARKLIDDLIGPDGKKPLDRKNSIA